MGILRTAEMRSYTARSVVVALLFCAAMLRQAPHGQAQARPPLLVIVSTATATGGGDISLSKLRSAFESQPTDYRGVRLIPFNLPVGNSARALIDRAVLGLAPERVGAFWIDQKIRSGISSPRTVSSPEMLLRVVASMRGVIGYAELNPSAVPTGIQVLTVDGKRAQDPGYPLAAP
jgi:hypothetical protein